MCTTRQENKLLAQIFKGRQERTGPHKKCGALPDVKPYPRLTDSRITLPIKKKRELLPGAPADVSEFGCVAPVATWWQYACSGSGILTRFPFDRRSTNGTLCNRVSLSLWID